MAKIDRALVFALVVGLLTLAASNKINDDTSSSSDTISSSQEFSWRDY